MQSYQNERTHKPVHIYTIKQLKWDLQIWSKDNAYMSKNGIHKTMQNGCTP